MRVLGPRISCRLRSPVSRSWCTFVGSNDDHIVIRVLGLFFRLTVDHGHHTQNGNEKSQ